MASLPSTKPRLLVVDDDPLITDTLAFALGADYDVLACASRTEAIARLRALDVPAPLALVDLGFAATPHTPDEGFQLIADLLCPCAAHEDLRAFRAERCRERAPRTGARRLGVRREAERAGAPEAHVRARASRAGRRRSGSGRREPRRSPA
jgi:two-component system nitrogen regulation response regulator GlnG